MKDFVGKYVKINVYGVIYDGTITEDNEDTLVLEENCGSSKLVKILYKNNIAAIEVRVSAY